MAVEDPPAYEDARKDERLDNGDGTIPHTPRRPSPPPYDGLSVHDPGAGTREPAIVMVEPRERSEDRHNHNAVREAENGNHQRNDTQVDAQERFFTMTDCVIFNCASLFSTLMWLVLVLIASLKGWGNYDAFICIPILLGAFPGFLGFGAPASMDEVSEIIGPLVAICFGASSFLMWVIIFFTALGQPGWCPGEKSKDGAEDCGPEGPYELMFKMAAVGGGLSLVNTLVGLLGCCIAGWRRRH